MTPQSPFPPVIDSSMRSEFIACPESFNRRYLQGWQRPGRSIHLHFGAVFAAGMATFRNAYYGVFDSADGSYNVDQALGVAAARMVTEWGDYEPNTAFPSTKTLESCLGALESYVAQYPPATDHIQPARSPTGDLAVEFSFALPLPIAHPQTGEPLLYSGRFDLVGQMGTTLVGVDEKTTTQLGPTWGQQWRLRAQFTGYTWGARAYGYDLQGFVVRGVSILKRGFGHAEVIESRPQWMIDRWYHQLCDDVRRMVDLWQARRDFERPWPQALDSACGSYGGCQFLDLCTTEHPEKWLDDYEQHHYDPLGGTGAQGAPT